MQGMTELVYMEHMHDLEADARVVRVEDQDGRSVVILDRTVLYPQGGGQPYDTGSITNGASTFTVEEVRFVDGEVRHIGRFSGPAFLPDEDVHMTVDAERRKLNARLHSAGHLVDMAVTELGLAWTPGKGYHFPDGPSVAYAGQLDPERRDDTMTQIQQQVDKLVQQDLPVSARFVTYEELQQICHHVPDTLPAGKPIRVVQFDDFAVPCGGTHVRSLGELGQVSIAKIKIKDGSVTVGYDVSR